MKTFLTLVLLFTLIGCDSKEPYGKCGKFIVKNGTSAWNNGSIYGVDSVQMKSSNEIDIWIGGKKQTIQAQWIQVGRTPDCH